MNINDFHIVYISFGSNIGKKLFNIIKALKEIEIQLGRIDKISSLYKTKSWGFNSRDFYNGCLILKTRFSPKLVLKKLKHIELSIGRLKNPSQDYQSREIDLDILFFDQLIVDSNELKIPHPQIAKRNFVLVPMLELSPDLTHPKNNFSIKSLLLKSEDNLEIKKIKNNNFYIPFWERFPFVSIEGNIGAGKSTLSKKFKYHFEIEELKENFTNNPFLKKFYLKPEEFALKTENYFLNDRKNQIIKHFFGFPKRKTVSDFWIGKSLVFAKNNLSKNSYKKLHNDFIKLNGILIHPKIIIYLNQNILQLKKQIAERGRSYEKNISEDYLKSILKGYEFIFDKNQNFILIILTPREVLELKSSQGLERLFRKIINL